MSRLGQQLEMETGALVCEYSYSLQPYCRPGKAVDTTFLREKSIIVEITGHFFLWRTYVYFQLGKGTPALATLQEKEVEQEELFFEACTP